EELLRQLAKAPDDTRLLQKLGELLQKEGEDRKAAEMFARVAANYERDGFFLKAVALLKQVVRLSFDVTRVEKLAILHEKLGLTREAGEVRRLAVEHERRARQRERPDRVIARPHGLL